ncbi:MAG: hypothetical protein OET44_12840 [Gammaproteobacteria bacterium]|nr:hypothetical protein [Gammaproteobacteria bacterium]
MFAALMVLLLFGAAAWAVMRFGGDYLPAERQRGIVAGGIAVGGLLVASLAFFAGQDSPPVSEFLVTTDVNQGAVSYPLRIERAGIEHELQIWPQREAGNEPQGLLQLRVILSGPDGATLINETVTIASGETDIATTEGGSVRGIDWIAWSKNFTPASAGFYEIALSMPPKAPRVRVRVGATDNK